MAEGSAGRPSACRDVAYELDPRRVGSFRSVELLRRAFDAIDDRDERDMTAEAVAAIAVHAADGCADLIVGIGADVFHEEIDQARIALEDLQDLQGSVAGFDFGKLDYRRGLYFRKAIGSGDVFGQNAGEEQREEAAEGSRDSRQITTSELEGYQAIHRWRGREDGARYLN